LGARAAPTMIPSRVRSRDDLPRESHGRSRNCARGAVRGLRRSHLVRLLAFRKIE
jgi:hypothetical protein